MAHLLASKSLFSHNFEGLSLTPSPKQERQAPLQKAPYMDLGEHSQFAMMASPGSTAQQLLQRAQDFGTVASIDLEMVDSWGIVLVTFVASSPALSQYRIRQGLYPVPPASQTRSAPETAFPPPPGLELDGSGILESSEDNKSTDEEEDAAFAVDMDAILQGRERRTTVMVSNIPNRLTETRLRELFDQHVKGQYTCFYLKVQHSRKVNLGFGFLNFVDSAAVGRFYKAFHGMKWSELIGGNSTKTCKVMYSNRQLGRRRAGHV